jgi:hypothetical protein
MALISSIQRHPVEFWLGPAIACLAFFVCLGIGLEVKHRKVREMG